MSNKFQNEDFKSEAELISAGATKSSLLNTTKIFSSKSNEILETLLRKNNFAGSVAPSVTDDSSQGYEVGSVWIDTVNEKSYNCISNGVGTALWKEGGGGVATANGLTAIVEILNNQAVAVNTGIVFSYPTIKSFEIFAQIIRTTSTTASTEVTKILGVYDIATNAWVLTDVAANNSGVTFSITAIGEIQYTSTNLAGATYVGEMAYSYQANGGAISGTSPNDLSAEGLNYISKGNAESGTNGWLTYADAAATKPVDGSGGAANITFAETSVAPLRGLKSFLLSKDAVNRQGQGVGYNFTIDNASKAKVLTIDFDYIVNSGTFVAGTNTTLSDLIVSIYDVTNAVIIEPSSIKLFSNSATVADKFSATFQTSHNSNNYRLIFHVSSTSALAYSLKIDNISVAPSKYVYGTPITDWQSYTPAGTFTNTSYTGRWRRVGDSMQVMFRALLSAAPAAGNFNLSIPSGYLIDSTKFSNSTPEFLTSVFGTAHALDVSTSAHFTFQMGYASATSVFATYQATLAGQVSGISNNLPFVWAINDVIDGTFQVPIVGWSSSVQMSDTTVNREVSLIASRNSLPIAVGTPLIFNSVERDSVGGYNSTTGQYTIPESGTYNLSFLLNYTHSSASGNYGNIGFTVNGIQHKYFTTRAVLNEVTKSVSFCVTSILKAGDVIDVRVFATNITGITAQADPSHFHITKISNPSAIAASESVVEIRENTAGTVIPSVTQITIPYNSVIKSSHGSWSSNRFYAPIAGTYNISLAYQHVSAAIARPFEVIIVKNNLTTEFQTAYRASSTATTDGSYGDRHATNLSTLVDMKSGDFIEIRVQSPSGSTSLSVGTGANRIAIHRVGN